MKLEALYNLYYERHVKVKTQCPQNAFYWWKVHGSYWGSVEVEDITRRQVQDWVDQLGSKSTSSATRAVNQLSALINWGLKREYITGTNPCRGVERFKVQSRERFLQPAEFERFKASLDKEPDHIRDFYWLLLLTGARRGCVEAMRWDEVDTKLKIWRIPQTKNGDSHLVALPTAALAILDRRFARYRSSDWVFPGRKSGGHFKSPKRSWARICKRAGIKDLRVHDLRRTLGSYLAIQGESLTIIGKALGHRDQRSTAVYARLHLDPVRAAVQRVQNGWGDNERKIG